MMETRRAVRPRSRRAPTSNPVRNLEMREDVSSEYSEEIRDLTDDFIKDFLGPTMSKSAAINSNRSPRHSPTPFTKKDEKGLTKEAQDALRATEDYTKIELRQGHCQKAVREVAGGNQQLQETLLLMIKGKHSMQTRLVEPKFASLTKQDVFVLITPTALYQFNGTNASVIKKSKGNEICKSITIAKEFKCQANDVIVLDENRGSYVMKKFFKVLNIRNENSTVSGKTTDDEEYEQEQNSENRSFVLGSDTISFIAVDTLSGKKISHYRLDNNQIYCFDFGPEVYVWIGKTADRNSRKNAMIAGREVFDSKPRPSWGLYQRIAGGLETSLFREKFKDWPDANSSNVLSVKNSCAPLKDKMTFVEMEPCDWVAMREPLSECPQGMVLEMTDVGRGDGVSMDLAQDIFGHDVETTSIDTWRITDTSYEAYPTEKYGQFYSGESFIVRWGYRVMQGGKKQDHDTGRDRAAFFFWQGLDCSIKEKGKSAFMTVKVDRERAPQVQLTQANEPPPFLQMFKGAMVTFTGKISDPTPDTRLFLYRGEVEKEGTFSEITPLTPDALRSRSSFLLMEGDTKYHVWHGCKSRAHTVTGCFNAAVVLSEMLGMKPSIVEIQEGSESNQFWSLFLGGKQPYSSLLKDERMYTKSLRLYQLYEEQKHFTYREFEYNCRVKGVAAPYPFLQSDIYNAEQPALFIVDAIFTVYVWVGWWPGYTPDGEALTHTGSAKTDFTERYKLALQTTVGYTEQDRSKDIPDMIVVRAGSEPDDFKALFPWWKERDDVPRDQSGPVPLADELKKFLQTQFTLQELQQRPPPPGCDPLKLEQYLSTSEFQEIFDMTKKDFNYLQPWKQRNLRSNYGLF